MDVGVDLRRPARTSAGNRPRRARASAIPLSRAMARSTRSAQIPPDGELCRATADDPRRRAARSRRSRAHAAQAARGDGAPARPHVHAHRRRALSSRQRQLRIDDAAHAPRTCVGRSNPSALSRQVRQGARCVARRSPARANPQAVPRPARLRALPVRRRWRDAQDLRDRRQRLPAGGGRRRLHGEGFPNVGRHRHRDSAADALRSRRVGARAHEGRQPCAASVPEKTNQAPGVAAHALGNTLAVCRKSYVHPGVVDAYAAGTMPPRRVRRRRKGLRVAECRTLALLEKLAPRASRKPRASSRNARRATQPPVAVASRVRLPPAMPAGQDGA